MAIDATGSTAGKVALTTLYDENQIYGGNHVLYLSSDFDDIHEKDIISGYFVKNKQLFQLPAKESSYLTWDLEKEQWIEPEGYLNFIRKESIDETNKIAGDNILIKYPIYKQINLPYDNPDEAAIMRSWINSIRELSNTYCAQINSATLKSEMTTIISQFKEALVLIL